MILAAGLGSGMAFLDGTVVNVALRRLGQDLDATLAELQWISNGYLLSLASLILLGGSLGDRFGRRRVFVIGDSLHDVTAAKANGAVAIGVATGRNSVDELLEAGADVALPDLTATGPLVALLSR